MASKISAIPRAWRVEMTTERLPPEATAMGLMPEVSMARSTTDLMALTSSIMVRKRASLVSRSSATGRLRPLRSLMISRILAVGVPPSS